MDTIITRSNFTWSRFLRCDEPIVGLENHVSPAGGGRYVPFEIFTRDMQTGISAQGGALVSSDVDKKVIDYLRPKSVCARLGAEIRTGLIPPTGMPVVIGDSTASWLYENSITPASDLTVGQMLLSPHRVSITLTASQLLAAQSTPDFDRAISEIASRKLFQALDAAALTGSGGPQPVGIINTTGVGSVTFGGAASWAKVLSFESSLGNANADGPTMGWAQSPNTRARWKQIQRASGTSSFLQDDDNSTAGYPSAMTISLNSVNANDRCVFGNWSDLVLGIFFDGIWVVKNPYKLSSSGETIYSFHLYADVGLKHPASFCASSDSAAQ